MGKSKEVRTNLVGGPYDGWGFPYPGDDKAPKWVKFGSCDVYVRTGLHDYTWRGTHPAVTQ